jgi:hypothetical protein
MFEPGSPPPPGSPAGPGLPLADLDQQKQRYVSPYTIATIYAGLGEKDQAFKWLEKAVEDRDIWLMNLKVDPVLKSPRSEPGFERLLQRIGLTP